MRHWESNAASWAEKEEKESHMRGGDTAHNPHGSMGAWGAWGGLCGVALAAWHAEQRSPPPWLLRSSAGERAIGRTALYFARHQDR